jgi:hypothetical protein
MKPFEPKGLPRGALALADPGRAYLVWSPGGGLIALDLSGQTETFTAGWVDLKTGQVKAAGDPIRGGRAVEFRPPAGGPAVLWLERK